VGVKKYRGIIIAFISVLLSTLLWVTGGLVSFENLTWDSRVKLLSNNEKASDKVVLILLDQISLDWAEQEQGLPWPWPREVLTTIINSVSRAGAKSISFDVLYTEASIHGVWDDSAFGDSIEESNIFIGSTTLMNKPTKDNISLPTGEIVIDGLKEWLDLKSTNIDIFNSITETIPEVLNKSRFVANVKIEPDSDGTYRRGQLFYLYNNKVIPSHALASYIMDKKYKISIKKGILKIDDKVIPINNRGEAILNFRGPSGTYKSINAAKIINSEISYLNGEESDIDLSIFKDSHVLFGYKAAGLLDLRATPISGKETGVEIHATMLDNLLTDDFISEFNIFLSILLTLLLCSIAGFLYTKYQDIKKGIFFYLVFIGSTIVLSIILYVNNIWYPLFYTEISILITLTTSGIFNLATEGKQKRFIKSVFRQYLSPDYIENILKDPGKLKLGGEKKELSIFFSDLEGFTTISEGLSPEDLTKLINEYLTAMTDIILDEGGTIDKYEGDAIIAFWNAPIDYQDHAIRAVRAALRCQKKLEELRPYFKETTGHIMKMRIGINTGDAIVGNMGSNTRFDYTMLGDSVNLAARLEGVNKQFGTYTMISKSTYNRLNSVFPVRELGKVRVVGKRESITVYEPMLKEDYNDKIYDRFLIGLNHFYNSNFNEAIDNFSEIPSDPVSQKYITMINRIKNSNQEKWDGTLTLTEK